MCGHTYQGHLKRLWLHIWVWPQVHQNGSWGKNCWQNSPMGAWFDRSQVSCTTSLGWHALLVVSVEVLPLTTCCWLSLNSTKREPVQNSHMCIHPQVECIYPVFWHTVPHLIAYCYCRGYPTITAKHHHCYHCSPHCHCFIIIYHTGYTTSFHFTITIHPWTFSAIAQLPLPSKYFIFLMWQLVLWCRVCHFQHGLS